ncbi:Fic family protein [Microcoleus vaginatus DQ-U2]
MNHPFIDGNKRTAFAVTDTFLRLNAGTRNLTDDRA